MTQQQTRSRRDPDDETASHEQELAEYLQERIKPGLNRGSIPLLARSIAKEIVDREHLNGEADDAEADEQPAAAADDEPAGEVDDDAEATDDGDAEAEDDYDYEDEDESDDDAEKDDEPSEESEPLQDFEAEMHELQAELGDDWILRFSVQGDDAWLTAEKKDASQHVEAATAEVLLEAVEVLDEGGEQSG